MKIGVVLPLSARRGSRVYNETENERLAACAMADKIVRETEKSLSDDELHDLGFDAGEAFEREFIIITQWTVKDKTVRSHPMIGGGLVIGMGGGRVRVGATCQLFLCQRGK